MSPAADKTLDRHLVRGTAAERAAYTPVPWPAVTEHDSGYLFFETDTGRLYTWGGSAWQLAAVTPGAVDAPSGLTTSFNTLVGRYAGSGPTLLGLQQIALGGPFDMSTGTLNLASSFYATGTWTPTIIGSTGFSGQVYAVQDGRYVKIGQLVVAWFRVKLTSLGTLSGSVQIGGLPYTVYNDANAPWTSPVFWDALNTAYVVVQCNPSANTTAATLVAIGAASTSLVAFLSQSNLTANSEFRSSLVYLTN